MRPFRATRPLVAGLLVLAASGFVGAFQLIPGVYDRSRYYSWPVHSTALYIDPLLKRGTPHGDAVRAGATVWNVAPGSDWKFVTVDGFHDPIVGDLDGFNDVMLVPMGPGGHAYIRYGSGTYDLVDVDVAISSGPYGGMRIWDTSLTGGYPGSGYMDLQTVAAHEFGHVLGFNHHEDMDGPSVMGFCTTGRKNPSADDLAGVAFLYPAGGAKPPPAGGGTPDGEPLLTSLPFRNGLVPRFECAPAAVAAGESIRMTVTVSAPTDGGLLFQSVATAPSTVGGFPALRLEAGESRTFELDRTVSDLPGLYPKVIRFLGQAPGMNFSAAASLPDDLLRVSRAGVDLPIQDAISSALGPGGEDRVHLFLAKGSRVLLEWTGGAPGEAPVTVAVTDPEGREVRVRSGAGWRARTTGIHVTTVRNPSATRANYGLFTHGVLDPVSARVRARWAGSGETEVLFPFAARAVGTVQVAGPARLGLRIVGLRDPSGREVAIAPGASVPLDAPGVDGVWTARVQGAPGESGPFRLRTRAEWGTGEHVSR